MISKEQIEQFLTGTDPEKYIVSLEYNYADSKIYKIIQDPELGKLIKPDTFMPFAWVGDLSEKNFYKQDKAAQKKAMSEHGILIKKLRTDKNERLERGLKYLVQSTKNYAALVTFFKNGGLDPWEKGNQNYIQILTPVEQYLIQKKKRLFKGYEEYNDIHRFVFDIETTSLDPTTGRIFLIGIKDNKGFEEVLYSSNDDEERKMITDFFDIIRKLKPTIIGGYNSAFFDFPFIVKRAEILGLDIRKISVMLKQGEYLKFKEGVLKLGGETESYQQYKMWGHNVVDIAHSVRRAQAINSDIKSWTLKYITKFIEKEKPNRVYVEGSKIYKIYEENKSYYMNPKTGHYKEVTPELTEQLSKFIEQGKYEVWEGKKIIRQYLLDDIWETITVDDSFNQATFLISKLVPTTYERVATMGTATLWKMIMLAWSYENELAIPAKQAKREFTGGLSRLVNVGYAKNIVKFDFSSLYPSLQLVYDIFPDCDITHAMKSLLSYFRSTRIYYKREAEKLKNTDKKLSEAYDRKQLPIKIFINAFFGSVSAPEVFPWADMDMGEKITCTGRQALRMMMMFFMNKGYKPTVCDTDGMNFIYPEEAKEARYIGKGNNELVEAGKEYVGVKAHVAEFNDIFMKREMGLDIDYFAESTINLARKNYAILNEKGKVKLTGNSIKSKKIQGYISEFLDKAIRLLLDGKGCDFIEYYYEYVSKIYNKEIPLSKIANKARVKQSLETYKKHIKKRTKAGNLMSRQAHMELLLNSDFSPNLGDTVYYINNGSKKSHGDVVKNSPKKNKDGELILPKEEITINCYLITEAEISANPDLKGEYNVPRYLSAFNKRINPLLVCFHPEVRDSILVDNPEKRAFFTASQCQLVAGYPFEEDEQDNLDDILTLSESEIKFYRKTGLDPYYMYFDNTIEMIDHKWVSFNRQLITNPTI